MATEDARYESVDTRPLVHPDRVPLKRRPVAAIRHFRQLIRDKDDTKIAFRVYEALPMAGFIERAVRFADSPMGRRVRSTEAKLPPILDDHAALARYPEGSLAREYLRFMQSERLSAEGLVGEHEKFREGKRRYHDMVEWYDDRLRDTHDLLHVLSGYGRDALGELCVLLFTYGQNPAPAHLLIGYAGALATQVEAGWGAPVMRAAREAQRRGRGLPPIVERPVSELLGRPLAELRRELGLGPPVLYRRCLAIWERAGLDPNGFLKTGAAPA